MASDTLAWEGIDYEVLRDGAIVGTSPTPSFDDTTAPSGSHVYQVDAVDMKFNRTPRSDGLTAVIP